MLIFVLVTLIVLYPLYFILIGAFSDPNLVSRGEVWLYPKGLNFDGFERIFSNGYIWTGYRNTIVYAALGTAISVALTITAAYALARKDLIGRNVIMFAITFTMFFSGGLIPTYLLVRELGMVNTMWALVLLPAVSVYQLIIARTFIQATIPEELFEAASIDGCNHTTFFFRMVLPLSQAIIAVIVLFNVVFHWNSYFPALIYLRDRELQPLQLVLREILIQSQSSDMSGGYFEDTAEQQKLAESIKYGMVIVASLPMLVLYPFLQKYFVKGVMIGSIKG
ncbi:carbohydrate ABC transporter permease [Paenibacillus sabuli]|nr:carbohydrate ABC transporter permease [Paenibacillus sabuli]